MSAPVIRAALGRAVRAALVLWFLLPLVGWGAVLALHVAYVMGLFAIFSDRK